MSPIGSRHADLVDELLELLMNSLGKQCRIRLQSPIRLHANNIPQPNITLFNRNKDYQSSRPQAADIFVVIEVSDTTLEADQKDKLQLYAVAGIPEYWIVDATGNQIEQYTQPTPKGYTQKVILKAGDTLKTAQFAEFSLSINQLFRIDPPNAE
jgi:Uma2 family endonuclease